MSNKKVDFVLTEWDEEAEEYVPVDDPEKSEKENMQDALAFVGKVLDSESEPQ